MFEDEHKKHCFYRYLGLFLATMLGAFLAVYFVADITLNNLMNPYVAMHRMDREFKKMDKEFVRELPPHPHMKRHNTIDFFRTPDEYKFIIDLKPFNGNSNNIKVETADHTITISGEATVNKKHSETFTSFSQTYTLDDDANFAKMTKKTHHDKYIITVPLEDND